MSKAVARNFPMGSNRRRFLCAGVFCAGLLSQARADSGPQPRRSPAVLEVERLIDALQAGPALAAGRLRALLGAELKPAAGADDHEYTTAEMAKGPFARLERRRWLSPKDRGGGLALYVRDAVVIKVTELLPRFRGSTELPLHGNPDRIVMEVGGTPVRKLVLFFRMDDRTLFKVQFTRQSASD